VSSVCSCGRECECDFCGWVMRHSGLCMHAIVCMCVRVQLHACVCIPVYESVATF